jgi:hypothetical protein
MLKKESKVYYVSTSNFVLASKVRIYYLYYDSHKIKEILTSIFSVWVIRFLSFKMFPNYNTSNTMQRSLLCSLIE